MTTRRGLHPVKHTRTTTRTDGIARRLAVCLMLCAAALGCRLVYPQGIETMKQVVFGEADGAVRQAFAGFTQTMEEQGVAEAFSGLYGELLNRAQD